MSKNGAFSGIVAVCLVVFLSVSCAPTPQKTHTTAEENLQNHILKVALEPDPTDYFLYQGHPMGYHLELLQMLAEHLDCRLIVVGGAGTKGIKEQAELLQNGDIDIIASNLNITEERRRHLLFTRPLYRAPQVLVQLKKEYLSDTTAFVDSLPQIFGKTVTVRKKSVFEQQLQQCDRQRPARAPAIAIERSHKIEERLLREVALGKTDYTVASQNKAQRFVMSHPQLDIHLRISDPQEVAWALRPTDDSLQKIVNRWLDSLDRNGQLDYLYHKYYELSPGNTVKSTVSGFKKIDSVNRKHRIRNFELLVEEGVLDVSDSTLFQSTIRRAKNYIKPAGKGKFSISPYDKIIKKYAKEIPWDWHLLASLIYQESQFQSHLVSKKGAIGLMQMMPATAKRYNITLRSDEETQICAGAKYIKSLYAYFPDSIPEAERTYFVLASYNIGPGHILDARRLSQKYGADPNVWYNNVENYLRLLSKPEFYNDTACRNGRAYGRQTIDFVRKIDERYIHYVNLIP